MGGGTESLLQSDVENDAERLFLNSIKSKETKRVYLIHLQKYLEFVHCKTINDLIVEFKNPKDIERRIIDFIIKMKDEGRNFNSISNYIKPVISFYKINDIMLNSRKINKFMPSKTRVKKNRGYSYEEVQKLLDIADERIRAVILLLVSSGCRVGAIPTLHVRDIEKTGDVYKITIYENEEEEYFSFITAEAWNAVEAYLSMRRRMGEAVGPDFILVREQFDIRDPFAIASPKPVIANNLSNKIALLAERAGIREKTVMKESEKGGSFRKSVPRVHGLRKAFSTFALNAKMDIIKRRMLEGHSVGIDEHYCKPSEADLQEEYMKGVDALTIDPTQRMARQIRSLQEEKTEIQSLRLELEKVKRAIKLNK
jgi:integrase